MTFFVSDTTNFDTKSKAENCHIWTKYLFYISIDHIKSLWSILCITESGSSFALLNYKNKAWIPYGQPSDGYRYLNIVVKYKDDWNNSKKYFDYIDDCWFGICSKYFGFHTPKLAKQGAQNRSRQIFAITIIHDLVGLFSTHDAYRWVRLSILRVFLPWYLPYRFLSVTTFCDPLFCIWHFPSRTPSPRR